MSKEDQYPVHARHSRATSSWSQLERIFRDLKGTAVSAKAVVEAATMLKHNSYFAGKVQSVGFERLGRRHSVGVIDEGSHTFGTEAPERMSIVSGELFVTLPGQENSRAYPAGTSFEVAGNSSFSVVASAPVAYLCEYL